MEWDLVVNYCKYPITKDMWNGIAGTYSKKKDGFQIFELTVKANNMKKRSDSVEEYVRNL